MLWCRLTRENGRRMKFADTATTAVFTGLKKNIPPARPAADNS
jgi:hypothetical protein